jgi:hypothetical protein
LSPQTGRTIISFLGSNYLLASYPNGTDPNASYNSSRSSLFSTSLTAGTYDVTLVGWDGYLDRDTTDPLLIGVNYQNNEKYFLRLYNGSTTVADTNSTTDLTDWVDEATYNGKVNDNLVLSSDVNYVQGIHPWYPGVSTYWESNSLLPICAAFDNQAPPSASGTISGVGCTIAEGGDDCSGTLSWNIENATSPSVENLSTASVVSTNASGTNAAVTIPYGVNTYAIKSGTSTITTTNLLAACASSTTWNGTVCAPDAPELVPPVLDIEVDKNFIRKGGKTNIDFTVNANHNTTCTITGVQDTPIVFSHNAATSSAVYPYTTKSLNATQKIAMTCTASGLDDETIEGRVNVIPSFEEF